MAPGQGAQCPAQLPGSLGFVGVAFLLLSATQGIVAGVLLRDRFASCPPADPARLVTAATTNGYLIAVGVCIAGPVLVAAVAVFAAARRGLGLREYLALRRPDPRALAGWTIVALAFVVANGAVSSVLGRPLPAFLVSMHETARSLPLLWLAIVVVAPLYEEILFRGFLFAGVQRSGAGPAGAVAVTAVIWTASHLQYEW
jgi:CAAX protease family protein